MTLSIDDTYRKDTRWPVGHGYDRRPDGAAIQSVILHATHGRHGSTDAAECAYLRDSSAVSAHYLIGRAGRIYGILPEHYRAWHAGMVVNARWSNDVSIGIELHAATTEPITREQRAALAWLLLDMRERYHLGTPDIRSHRSVAAPPGRKSDPAAWNDDDLTRWIATLFATGLNPDLPGITPATEDSPLVAVPSGNEETFTAAWLERASRVHYDDVSIVTIARAYWKIATAAGLDPWLAAGQCMHESGWLSSFWCSRPRRNGCGYGVTGRRVSRDEYERNPAKYPNSAWVWSDDGQTRIQGVAFPTWAEHSVPAHCGRLLAYAVRPGTETPEQKQLIAFALAYRSLPDTVRGTAPRLKLLGRVHNPSGLGWASPGTDYGVKVAAAANRLLGLRIAE